MELGGYTGDRVWLIALVAAFNLACIMLWFIVGALKRAQGSTLTEAQTFIELMRRKRDDGSVTLTSARKDELEASLVEAEGMLAEGEGLGPLWGRRHMTNANIVLHGVADRFPELSDSVNEQMVR
ncbi:MAG: hypothetical protein KDA24_03280 [Deltaproteobacteria bacterium]|nr:hypothetical protein [Deltaproteobacteria bacterium]